MVNSKVTAAVFAAMLVPAALFGEIDFDRARKEANAIMHMFLTAGKNGKPVGLENADEAKDCVWQERKNAYLAAQNTDNSKDFLNKQNQIKDALLRNHITFVSMLNDNGFDSNDIKNAQEAQYGLFVQQIISAHYALMEFTADFSTDIVEQVREVLSAKLGYNVVLDELVDGVWKKKASGFWKKTAIVGGSLAAVVAMYFGMKKFAPGTCDTLRDQIAKLTKHLLTAPTPTE